LPVFLLATLRPSALFGSGTRQPPTRLASP
jgi:hypothetical protein